MTGRAGTGAVTMVVGAVVLVGYASGSSHEPKPTDYRGGPEIVRVPDAAPPAAAAGVVFDDANRDARRQDGEGGIAGVSVTNGREVVVTGDDGRYQLPAYNNMTVSVTKPPGYDTPVDENNFPQFFYHHLPEGSPELRFGGLPPTGPLPQEINFPLAESAQSGDEVSCAFVGDTQTYSNREIGYLRDGVVTALAERDDVDHCGALLLGDLMGDDLGLYPRFKDVMAEADMPLRGVPGNHDLDFDATVDEHSTDTYRREIGPGHYSYDVGNVHIVGLDNVRYPCTPEQDNADGKHPFCDDPAEHPTYNGVIGEEQMTWLANDLAHVPEDKLVVIATHIPLVTFIDQNSTKHQTDDVEELYSLLEGRPALSLSGHTHTLENMVTGDSYEGWEEAVGVEALPFPHIVAGAASGTWWSGDLDVDGRPMALGREGEPPGYLTIDFDGSAFQDTYHATAFPDDQQMSLSISSPYFRAWYDTLANWKLENPQGSWSRPRSTSTTWATRTCSPGPTWPATAAAISWPTSGTGRPTGR